MKICLVCPYDLSRPGGVQHHIRDLARSLGEHGHICEIVAPGTSRANPSVNSFGKTISLPFNGAKIDLCFALGHENTRLRRFLKEGDFDVVHFHTVWNPVLPLQILYLCQGLRASRVATFHDTPANGWGRLLMKFASRLLQGQFHARISVSAAQARHLWESETVQIIPNGIFCQEFGGGHSRDDGTLKLLFIGALVKRKSVFDLIAAFARLKPRFPHLRLLLAGSGYLEAKIRKLIQEQSLVDVELLGPVDESTKRELLGSSHIFCSPAAFAESFGIVLLEAMASGLPAVGAANPGYQSVLTGEGERLLFEPNSVDELESLLEALITDLDFREEMACWGRETAGSYDWGRVTPQILEIYRGCFK